MKIRGNSGEWSEFYVFIKLLAEGKIYAADSDLEKNGDLFYVILKILRTGKKELEYLRSKDVEVIRSDGTTLARIPIKTLQTYSQTLFEGISKKEMKADLFQKEAAKMFMHLETNQLSDDRKNTADIRIVIHDPMTQFEPLLGFSIKSYMGSKPTLFNSSRKTNICYRILPDLKSGEKNYLNGLDSYGARVRWLTENDYSLQLHDYDSSTFRANLELIDSRLPEILGVMLIHNFVDKVNKVADLTKILCQKNPCNFNTLVNPQFYEYKIKRLLVDVALGMQAGKPWKGLFNADGGYIVVKKDGDLVCYHIYNWNEFQDYLISNTKIDHPSSSRHGYGDILDASEVGAIKGSYIKLNFQIRFT